LPPLTIRSASCSPKLGRLSTLLLNASLARTRIKGFVKTDRVAETAEALGSASRLVHGEILGGRTITRKLVKARQLNIAIITEEQFFNLLGLTRAEP
jgi:hypothetical protein